MPTSPARKADQYGPNHRRARARYQARLDAGEVIPCWRCGGPIDADTPMDLGHNELTGQTMGPEHRHAQADPYCPGNRGEAAARGNRARAQPRATTLRW